MKKILITLMLIFSFGQTKISMLHAQPSIIDQIQKTQPAIVTVTSKVSGVYQLPEVSMARDPHTGRVIAAHHVTQASYQRYGAGVIVHPSGLIVTNAHNIAKAEHIQVILSDQTETSAQVIDFINNIDLALLKINSATQLPSVKIADSDELKLGDSVITVGNSEYLKQTISGGKIIGLGTNRTETSHGKKRTDLIQTTINLYHGDSGGPLFDKDGQLIGLMTAKESNSIRSSFAVPSNKIVKYLSDYLNDEKKSNQ